MKAGSGGVHRTPRLEGRLVLSLLLVLLHTIVLLAGATSAQAAAQWSEFQRDLQHTGRSSVVGPSNANVNWSFSTALAASTPAIGADGTIYLPSGVLSSTSQGFLYAVNPDGTQKWRFDLAGPPASTAPAVASDGTIYVHSNGQGNVASIETLHAINPTGTLKWRFEFNDGAAVPSSSVQSSPAVAPDGTIWVGSGDTFLYALNPDGTLKCGITPTLSGISSSPAIAPNGTVYIVDASTTLFAFDSNCGFLWSFTLTANTFTSNPQSPAVGADGTIWVGSPSSSDRRVYAVNSNGTLKCSFLTGNPVRSTPAIAVDGTVYVSSDGVYALDPATCGQLWRFAPFLNSSTASPLVGGDGTIYWRTSFDQYAVNPDGTQKWTLPTNPSSGGVHPSGALGDNGVLYWADGGTFSGDPTRLRAFSTLFYARPKGATPVRVSLVPAYNKCTSSNRTHGPPLEHPSCSPPAQESNHLTVGTPDANGAAANSGGHVRFAVIVGNPATPADDADVRLNLSLTDVRRKSDLADYTGELQISSTIRMIDRLNGASLTEPGTMSDFTFSFISLCSATANTGIGSTCAVATTADAVIPGSVIESKRAIWQVGQVSVFDGGADGDVHTAPNTLFAKQGLFVP